MSCEDEPTRMTWEIQLYEPFSKVWMSRGLGWVATSAAPADIARAVLAGYLAAQPAGYGETFRATARPDGGEPVTVNAADLEDDAVTADPAVREALPLYLRDALPGAGTA
jgi:hypothetical protein